MTDNVRVIAVVDGEHHPGVVRDQLDLVALEHDLRAVLFAGGEEKVGKAVLQDSRASYGREVAIPSGDVHEALRDLARESGADAVLDLSGEPVLGPQARLELAASALAMGLEYRAAGLRLTPPHQERLDAATPTVAVIGTGKRTGKTAVAGHLAALAQADGRDPVIVSMGRGGPPEPRLLRAGEAPTLDDLLAMVRAGGHAASDYIEDAVLAGVATVGCRRCAEGPVGETFGSNVVEGARLALSLEPGLLLLEGSGAALPPVAGHRMLCVTHASRAPFEALSHLGPYRLLRSQLVVIVGADEVSAEALAELRAGLHRWCAASVLCRLELRPLTPLAPGARAAVFTTAPAAAEPRLRAQLEQQGVDVRLLSTNLARRAQLERDVEQAVREGCETFLTELKAAAIEVVAARAQQAGATVTFLRNVPVSLDDAPTLDGELRRLLDEAAAEARSAAPVGAGS